MSGWPAQNLDYLAFLALALALGGGLHAWLRRRGGPGLSPASLLLVLVVLIGGWFFVDRAGREARTGIREKVELLLPLYAREFQRLGHARVPTDAPPDNPDYLQLIRTQVEWLRLNTFVADIYTFRQLADHRLAIVVDSETDYDHDGRIAGPREQRTPAGQLFIKHSVARDQALAGQVSFDGNVYTDAWGSWVSAFTPLYDSAGRVEAVLGVDVGAALWHADIRQARLPWITFLGGLVVILLGGATLVAVLRHDLAERARTERQLRKQDELHRLLFERAPGGVTLTDRDFRLVEFNHAFGQMLGYTHDELLGLSLERITQPEDLARNQESHRRLAAGEMESDFLELRFRRKDGSLLEAIVTSGLVRDETGRPQYVLGHVTDVTGRRRAESELQVRQKQLETILSNMPVILCAIDAAGVFTVSEGAGLAAIGSRPGEFVGQSVFDRYAARPDLIADVRRALAGETLVVQREVEGAILEIHYTPLGGRGAGHGAIAIAIDITAREGTERERKKIERQLLDMQKLESLGILAGGVAHDFNNLLTSILGNANLARLALGEGSPVLHNVSQIEQASRTAANLCQQLLAYSGRGRLDAKELDLGELVREAADLLRLSLGDHATLQFALAAHLPTIVADSAQIRQVLLNLVINAAEAVNRRDGVITLTTRLQAIDAPWLAEARVGQDIRPGDYVCLELADNGPGLSPETQARIFEPFFTTKAEGRGLGLAAALGVMRSHHGALHLWSETGRGTRFCLAFPPHGRPAQPSAAGPAGRGWRGSGTVLIVDDDDAVRATAAQMTAYFGFQVRQASSGQQAVDFVRDSPAPFDLVLLDLTMPGMDGFATFGAIRQLRPDQRIVIFSGYSEQDAKQRFAGQNLSGFLQKPFSADSLRAVLRQASLN
jgi:PAS domain S-box-containing protein